MAASCEVVSRQLHPPGLAFWKRSAATILLSGVFLYLQVYSLPSTPRFASGDQAIYLYHGTRMLDGELIYRDYDHFTFPGTDVLYMSLFRLFGVRMCIPQAMLVVVGVSLVWLLTLISREVLTGWTCFLPALLFVSLPFSSYLDATHHWYSTVATTGAVAVLMKRRTLARLAGAGVLLGIAVFFTQSMALVLVGIAVFLAWEHRQELEPGHLLMKKESALVISFAATVAACVAYFVAKVGVRRMFYSTVVFVVKYYPADWFNNWRVYLTGRPHLHDPRSWIDIPAFALIHLIIPWVYVLFFLWPGAKPAATEDRKRLTLLAFAGISLFLSVASAPANIRLYAVGYPGLVLLVWILCSWQPGRKLIPLLWTTVLILAIARPLLMQLRSKTFLDLPTGRTAFVQPAFYDECRWLLARKSPEDTLFGNHLLSFALLMKSVGRVPFVTSTEYTRPEEVQDAIQALEKFQVRFVSWYAGIDTSTDAARHPEGDHLGPLRVYLHRHYRLAGTFSNGDQIWERNP